MVEYNDWQEYGSAVLHHLRARRHILTPKHRSLAQYLVIPSFEDPWCVDLVATGEVRVVVVCDGGARDTTQELAAPSSKPAAYLTCWRRSRDVEAFAEPFGRLKHPVAPEPSLESLLLPADPQRLERLLKAIADLRFGTPPLDTSSVSCDGVLYEFGLDDYWARLRMEWSNVLPEAWDGLKPVVEEFEALARLAQAGGLPGR